MDAMTKKIANQFQISGYKSNNHVIHCNSSGTLANSIWYQTMLGREKWVECVVMTTEEDDNSCCCKQTQTLV